MTRVKNKGTPAERFILRVVKGTDPEGCWEYDGFRFKGYGKFGVSPSVSVLAHRFAYELWVGPIPTGHVLHHLCENPACVRPSHLTPKNPTDHTMDHVLKRGVVENQHGLFGLRVTTNGTCEECGQPFEKKRGHAENPRFCDRTCANRWTSKHRRPKGFGLRRGLQLARGNDV